MPWCGVTPGLDPNTNVWDTGRDRNLLIECVAIGVPSAVPMAVQVIPPARADSTWRSISSSSRGRSSVSAWMWATLSLPLSASCLAARTRSGSAVEFVWRAWNGEYASLLSLKNRPGQRTDLDTLRTSTGIGLGSTQRELETAYGVDLVSDGRTYGPNQLSSKYSTSEGNIHFYSTDGVVTGISVSAPGGQSLDHFCT